MLFSSNGFQLVVMPLFTKEAEAEQSKAETTTEKPTEEVKEVAEPKPKRKAKREIESVVEAEPVADECIFRSKSAGVPEQTGHHSGRNRPPCRSKSATPDG